MTTSLTGSTTIPQGTTAFNLSIGLANSGDDTAFRVAVSGWSALPQITAADSPAGDLGPNGSAHLTLPLSIAPPLLPGSYAFAVITRYQDGNGYSFSSVTPTILSQGPAAAGTLSLEVAPASIEEKGNGAISVAVRNLGEAAQSADVFLVLPQELSSGGTSYPKQHVNLAPKSEGHLSFPLSSLGSLAGSTYSIAAIAQSNDGKKEEATIGNGSITVTKAGSSTGFLIGAFAVLLLVVGAVAYLTLKKKK